MEFLQKLKQVFETFVAPKAEAIRLDELPSGMDSIEAIMLGNFYKDAFEKGLFSESDADKVKTILRNLKLRHGDDVITEARIEATIACMQDACEDVAYIISQTDHVKTRAIVAETPEIWRR